MEMLITEVEARDIQHFTRDLANINALKNYILFLWGYILSFLIHVPGSSHT